MFSSSEDLLGNEKDAAAMLPSGFLPKSILHVAPGILKGKWTQRKNQGSQGRL